MTKRTIIFLTYLIILLFLTVVALAQIEEIEHMPEYPGVQKGQKVKFSFMIPINFNLE